MQSGTGRGAAGASESLCRHLVGLAAAMVLALTAVACTTAGQPMLSSGRGGTLAFDSIDGPPAGIFHKLVHNLNQEAQQRQLAVVSREAPSQYRVRGYLAAHIARGRTFIAWAWDVYDSEQRRVLRVSGEEPAGRQTRDAWNAADDDVLRRIARASLERLVASLGAPVPAPVFETEPPVERAIALASARP
jgi:hypothetical protein